jgi:cytochrome b subunit of formate dehydrogenase
MPFGALVDGLLVLHGGFVLFVVAGGLLVLRWPRLAWLHAPAGLWGALIEFAGFTCPLTPLENAWRRAAGQHAYQGGFIEHYVTAALYPSGLTRAVQIVLGLVVLGVNGWVYWTLWRRRSSPRPA